MNFIDLKFSGALFPDLCFIEFHTDLTNSSSGYITSPYYPALYLNNMRRFWKIKVATDERIKLSWSFINLEYDRHCGRDSVTILETKESRAFKSFCGHDLPDDYLTSGNQVFLEFKSSASIVGTGFKIRYQAMAGKI